MSKVIPKVPSEFDTLLAQVADNPAVRAVLTALEKEKIKSFTTHDGKLAGRLHQIYIVRADYPIASVIAAKVFATRKKFNSFAKVQPLPVMPGSTPMPGAGLPGQF